MEKDDELKGEGNSYDFGARLFDPRVARWFKCDPMEFKYPSLSTYNYANNSPLIFKDVDGRDIFIVITDNQTGKQSLIKYDRNMSENIKDKRALETIHALHILYDSKALSVKFPKNPGKCVDVLQYFLKPQNDLVIFPTGQYENKSIPSKAPDRFNKEGRTPINTSKYDKNGTRELDTRNTAFIEFDPNSGIIFSTEKTATSQYLETYQKKINLKGVSGFSYYSEKDKIGFHSPILQLAHEFMHAYNLFEDSDYSMRNHDKGGPGVVMGFGVKKGFFSGRLFSTAEEQFVIQILMPQVNENFGAPNPYDHTGREVMTDGADSVEPMSPDEHKGG